ncbi:N-acetyltransferase [Salinicoccus roseus]|uniref:GNAT family N-acetyltransferase n=1 Tax=Salinicoccus roseus TaxID=45670 RepID=UPI00158539A0|nr:GNAT family N-acetyltransferase [Salinicoccus roseus]MBY8908673.1 N-acetyltransferase [Salinicoccus roseus]
MDIKKGENIFFVGEDEVNPEAEIIFSVDDDGDYVVESTRVDDSLSGEGVGSQLVETMVEFAGQEDRKIDPQCPFTRNVMEKDDEMRKLIKN